MPTDKLISGHRRFRGLFAATPEPFTRLAREGQRPAVMWIGCADSRVIAEMITGAEPGDLFVVRNVGAIVPPCDAKDASVGAAVEFAVRTLEVGHIVVCGHTECGGLKELASGVDRLESPHTADWLEYAMPILESGTQARLGGAGNLEFLQAHVKHQHGNLLTYPCIRTALTERRLETHAWIYDIHSGALLAETGGTWHELGRAPSGAP